MILGLGLGLMGVEVFPPLSDTQFSRWVIDVDLEMSLLKGLWGKCGAL